MILIQFVLGIGCGKDKGKSSPPPAPPQYQVDPPKIPPPLPEPMDVDVRNLVEIVKGEECFIQNENWEEACQDRYSTVKFSDGSYVSPTMDETILVMESFINKLRTVNRYRSRVKAAFHLSSGKVTNWDPEVTLPNALVEVYRKIDLGPLSKASRDFQAVGDIAVQNF